MLALSYGASPAAADDFTQAMAYFYQTNPTILTAFENLRAQNEAYVQAREAFGPQVSVNFEADYQQAKVDQTNFFGQKYVSTLIGRTSTTSLDISQPIYSGGKLTAQVNGAQADVLAAREAARQAISQTFRSAIQAYVDVARDEAVLIATQHARDLLERDLFDMQEKFKAGAATLSDRAEVLARLAAARTQVASAEGQVQQSRAAYLSIIGQEPHSFQIPTDFPALPATREAAATAANVEAPSLKQAVFEEASARARVALAKSAFSPDISVRLSAQSLPLAQYQSGALDKNLSAGLVVQAPIFTSGVNLSKLRQAESQQRSARLKIEAARRAAVQAAEQAYASVETARKSVRLLTEQVRADRVAYESLNEQFKSGLISTIDLLNSEQELANAEISLAGAKHDFALAQADLLAAAGRLEAEVLIPDVIPKRPETDFRKLAIVSARLPTTLIVREIDRFSPTATEKVTRVQAQPLEKASPKSAPEPALDDMDPANVGAPPQSAEPKP